MNYTENIKLIEYILKALVTPIESISLYLREYNVMIIKEILRLKP